MKQTICNVFPSADAYILPFASPAKRHISLGKELDDAIDLALERHFQAGAGEVKALMVPVAGKLIQLVFQALAKCRSSPGSFISMRQKRSACAKTQAQSALR